MDKQKWKNLEDLNDKKFKKGSKKRGKWSGVPVEGQGSVPESQGVRGIYPDKGGLSRIKSRNGWEMVRSASGRTEKWAESPGVCEI